MRKWLAAGLMAGMTALGQIAAAQGMFSAVITVNDSAVTGFELDQRIRMLRVFNTPGLLEEVARTQLVEDRLKLQELERAGLSITDEALRAAMEEFAGRANLPLDQFLGILAAEGVEEQTLRDFVMVSVGWRDYIRARYNSRVTVTDADIDFAISQMDDGPAAVEVLLSEIIIPAPPAQAAQAQAVARQISQMTTTGAFEAAAREYSALPSREAGGRLDWAPLADYPEGLHGLILGLAPGEVSQPIPITNGIALFQMRDVREGAAAPVAYALVDYAVFHAAGPEDAQRVADRVDTCDDLYGLARGLPAEILERAEVAPAAIPQDVALALAGLDADETAIRPDGRLVMLCRRTPAAGVDADRTTVANQIRGERLAGYADALVEDLRAAATITGE